MKLNGWQRLWVVISLLWLASVATYTFYTFANKLSEPEIYHSWANELIGYLISNVSDLTGYSVTSLRSKYSDLSDKKLIEALNEKYINDATEPWIFLSVEKIAAKYEEKLTSKQDDYLFPAMVALIPPILIYLLGWAFVWVRNGFKDT